MGRIRHFAARTVRAETSSSTVWGMMSAVRRNQNRESVFRTSPLQGMVVSTLSKAEILSVVVIRSSSPRSRTSRTLPRLRRAAGGRSGRWSS